MHAASDSIIPYGVTEGKNFFNVSPTVPDCCQHM